MSYNWKCCSFYPNNFDASALVGADRSAHFGRCVCSSRSGYMRTSVGIHVYLGRGTCVPRSGYDDHQASLTRQRGCADSMVGVAVYDPAHRSGVGDPIVIK